MKNIWVFFKYGKTYKCILTEAVKLEGLMFHSFKVAKSSNTVLCMMCIMRYFGSRGRTLAGKYQSLAEEGWQRAGRISY